jgi:YHS domain-containing protein
MFRLLFRFLALVIFFAVVRYVFVAVVGLFSKILNPQARSSPQNQAAHAPMGGELRQDPVCGTFVPTATSVKQTINGELVHFCSVACRDKFKVA